MNRNVFHAKGKDRDNFKPGNMKNSQWNSMLLASLFCQLIDNFVSMYAGMCRYPLNYSCCSWCQVAYTRICTRLCKVLCLWFPDCSTDNESVTVRSTLIAVLTMSLWGAHWLQYWQWVCEEHTDSSTDNESVRSTTFFGFGLVSSCVTVSVAVMSACASLWFVVWAQVSTRCCYDNGRLVWLFCLRAWYA